jgi:hypothetical protein
MATTTQPLPAPLAAVDDAPVPSCTSASIAHADIGALEQVLRDDEVTFNDVARAWFHLCDGDLPESLRERCEQLYPALLRAFAEPRGGVVTAYFCRHVRVAAAMTDIHRAAQLGESLPQHARKHGREDRMSACSSAIHIECALGDPADANARAILFACLDIHYRAIEFLTPKPRKICMRMIMGVITSLLGILDERRCDRHDVRLEAHEHDCLEGVIEQARGYYDRSAQRQAQVEYFVGMGVGLLALVASLLAIGKITGARFDTDALLYTPLAGGLGAFVSVLARMTRGQLLLSYESGQAIMRLLGLIRPLLGAILGAAVYVLIAGGLVSFDPPQGTTTQLYFYVGLAFIAGFSERFAQDMVARVPGGDRPPSAARASADARQQLADAQRPGVARL